MFNYLCATAPGVTTPQDLEAVMQDPTQLKWYIVPLFLIVLYIGVSEWKKKNYSVVLGGAAFWLMDVFNETWNSMVYACTGQPVWGTTAAGESSLQILVGYNIEISFMFFILGMVACKMLKTTPGYEGESFMDGNAMWLDDPNNMYYRMNIKKSELTEEERKIRKKARMNRIGTALFGTLTAVIIEILLNACGVLTWEKPWWQPNMPVILFLIGYLPFYTMAYVVHDLPRKKQLKALGIILAVVVTLLIVAGSLSMLGHQLDAAGNWVGRWYHP